MGPLTLEGFSVVPEGFPEAHLGTQRPSSSTSPEGAQQPEVVDAPHQLVQGKTVLHSQGGDCGN